MFQVIRPYNIGTGRLRGAEFGYNQFFDFLPGWLKGFGVQANYTYLDSDGGVNNTISNVLATATVTGVDLPMVGISKHSYNFIAMYERGDWSARLAWNWRSRYLLATTDVSTNLPVWSDNYGELDGSVFYHINKNIQVGLQMNNLNNAKVHTLMGPSVNAVDGKLNPTLYTRGWFVADRRYELVFRAQF